MKIGSKVEWRKGRQVRVGHVWGFHCDWSRCQNDDCVEVIFLDRRSKMAENVDRSELTELAEVS